MEWPAKSYAPNSAMTSGCFLFLFNYFNVTITALATIEKISTSVICTSASID